MDESVEPVVEGASAQRRKRLVLGCGALLVLMVCSATAVLLTQYADGVDVTVEAGNGDAPATVSGTATVNAQVQGTEAVVVPPTSEREESVPGEEAGPAEESGPGNEARPGRIVFVNDAGRIGTVGPDGDQRRFITGEDDGIYLFPAWSPDGSSFAALGVQQSGSGVYVMDDEAESVITEIYFSHSGAPIYLFWRPAGDAISYIASGETALNLYLSSADGAGEPQLLVEGQPLYWDWVGDESRLLVHTGTPLGDSRLAFVDVAGEPDVSPNLSDAGYFQAPAISTGGSNVAFAELDDDAERWLAVQNVNSNEVQRTAHEGVVAMGWSPVEQLLAYISPDDPVRRFSLNYYGPLRVFDAGTGDIRVLTDETVLAFFWSPDGQTIAYFTVAPGVGEQIAEHPQGLVAPVRSKVHAQNEDFRLSLSLVDIGSGQPQRLVDFRPTELFLTQFLPYFDQYAHSHRLWSPDSQALVLPMMNEDQARIYVVPASGRGLSPVADGGVAFWSPR